MRIEIGFGPLRFTRGEAESDVIERLYVCCHGDRDEWVEAIQMVADKLAKQEEEGILCSPTTQIEIVSEEEMDTSISHHKRKVSRRGLLHAAHPAF